MGLKGINGVIIGIVILLLFSCQRDRYRHDNKNRMTKEAKTATTFLSDQAVELTQDNIDHRDQKVKKATKRAKKEQKELNELNENTSKVKRKGNEEVEFKFY